MNTFCLNLFVYLYAYLQCVKHLVKPVSIICYLGVWIDAELYQFATIGLYLDHRILIYISCDAFDQVASFWDKILRCILVLLKLDFSHGVFTAGLLTSTFAPLQSILLATTRLVNDLKPFDHVMTALKDLNWLLAHVANRPAFGRNVLLWCYRIAMRILFFLIYMLSVAEMRLYNLLYIDIVLWVHV